MSCMPATDADRAAMLETHAANLDEVLSAEC